MFDWYSASSSVGALSDVDRVLSAFPGGQLRDGPGRYGWRLGVEVVRDGRLLGRGYAHGRDGAFIELIGPGAALLSGALREVWPVHRVSRVDVAADRRCSYARAVRRLADLVPSVKRVEIRSTTGGATTYFGAPSSDTRVRVYKKTEQMSDVHGIEIEPGVVRFEVQVRPQSREKVRFASLDPDAVAGWRRLGRAAMTVAGERFAVARGVPDPVDTSGLGSWERTLGSLVRQYGPGIERTGDRASAVRDLLAALEERYGPAQPG